MFVANGTVIGTATLSPIGSVTARTTLRISTLPHGAHSSARCIWPTPRSAQSRHGQSDRELRTTNTERRAVRALFTFRRT
jgi:hypothetical protein